MNTADILHQVRQKALKESDFRAALLNSRNESEPLAAFCQICRENQFEIYEMELIAYGEESYAAMKRSTNGGGENSPMLDGEDDYYEMLMLELDHHGK